ncbi:hypothetical protein NL676_025209 [Syzygium grande]|nr:hypothetical protein NL676_025209 [Syzygium grande]
MAVGSCFAILAIHSVSFRVSIFFQRCSLQPDTPEVSLAPDVLDAPGAPDAPIWRFRHCSEGNTLNSPVLGRG